MKTLIIGMGKSGVAVYEFLKEEGETPSCFDDNPCLGNSEVSLQEFDRVVVSPGVSRLHPVVKEAESLGLEVTSEMELAVKRLKQRSIAITGTNGKTTVTLLIAHILGGTALGNVGTPLIAYVKKAKADEIAVIELSSYQLEALSGPLFDVGLILNITPDHLDRYASMEEYAKAKLRLEGCVKEELWAHETVTGLKLHYQTYGKNPSCTLWTDRVALWGKSGIELKLPEQYRSLGWHESENVLAAWIGCKHFGVLPEQFYKSRLETFKKPAHRIEWVESIDGVDYINDSKGTNIDATIKAVEAMQTAVVLIAGGVDKGASYESWKPCFQSKVKAVIAIGQASEKIARDLKPDYLVEIASTLEAAIKRAQMIAKGGECVLLSPGCSSFDMFDNYAQRGDEFKQVVHKLKAGEKE
jgi:UDP-N-acetylmuramoylalanine--D-glutamate ligase